MAQNSRFVGARLADPMLDAGANALRQPLTGDLTPDWYARGLIPPQQGLVPQLLPTNAWLFEQEYRANQERLAREEAERRGRR